MRPALTSRFFNPLFFSLLAGCWIANSHAFELTSTDVHDQQPLASAQVHKAFGCHGGNKSPALAWSGVPEGTKSFAITVYDPDALAGSGWWHWVAYDLPASVTQLDTGAASSLPGDAKQAQNDYAEKGFGGACPLPSDKPHRYVFTVYALKTDKLGAAKNAGGAAIENLLRNETLSSASITATYARQR